MSTPFAARGQGKSRRVNNVFLALLVEEKSYEDSVEQRHSAGEYEAVSCKNEGKYLYHL